MQAVRAFTSSIDQCISSLDILTSSVILAMAERNEYYPGVWRILPLRSIMFDFAYGVNVASLSLLIKRPLSSILRIEPSTVGPSLAYCIASDVVMVGHDVMMREPWMEIAIKLGKRVVQQGLFLGAAYTVIYVSHAVLPLTIKGESD